MDMRGKSVMNNAPVEFNRKMVFRGAVSSTTWPRNFCTAACTSFGVHIHKALKIQSVTDPSHIYRSSEASIK